MSATLPAEKILRELTGLWSMQGKEARAEEGAGVLRACSMTLVVLVDENDDLAALGEIIAALMPEHPSRAIVIRLTGASTDPLESRVYQQCWKPFGQRRQICCEQIEIKAPDAALAGLPWVVLPLAVADLPLIVWCRSRRLLDRAEFAAIAATAHKVIVDSAPAGEPGLRLVAGLIGHGGAAGDLAWTRLTRWREMLSQVFENRGNLAGIERLRRVSVNFAGSAETMNRYMAAWIRDSLRDAGVPVEVAAGGGPPVALTGDGFAVEMSREQDRMLTTVNGLTTCVSLSAPTEYLLMREELGIVRRDPVFERTVASAIRLAYANDR